MTIGSNVFQFYDGKIKYFVGCFDVLEDKLDTSKLFLSGTTLLDCLESCPDCHFIGLQVKI